ncbi:A24 family peptidase [Terrihabitans sp. B22-R8]|uniref:A24 family peptidase n=1 Tax=Terrihabitans sp. B22-R8 TaxID=3425128 RepID=UPI00403C37AE
MSGLALSALMIFPLLMIAAALFDLTTMTIPNWLNLLVAALFVPAALLAGLTWSVFGWHMLGALIIFAICLALFAMNLIGGGDAKLASAIALWLGPALLLPWALWFAIFGGLLGLVLIIFRRCPIFARAPAWIVRLHAPEEGVPYGLALAPAALLFYPQMAVVEAVSAAVS